MHHKQALKQASLVGNGERDSVVSIVEGCVSFEKSMLSNPDRQQLWNSCLSLRERDREKALLSSCKMRQ
ncbi:hypothetical protein T07_1713 [Trichinella nelsoni]|uniref:Uncharacterized protein n=1 Tax=Trichinella nelsoni TaxID=6336 RepID=A0A0V0S3R5_9BILA|nr:hypothetical protein T07_1713 [Trichinella nelsoni]